VVNSCSSFGRERGLLKRRFATILLVVVFSVGISIALFAQLSASSRKNPPGKVSPVSEASFVVFTDGFLVYARNGETGLVDFWGSNASEVIQAAIDGLGLHGGMVLIKEGSYVISRTIRVPGNVTLSGVGFATRLVLADYANQEVIENEHLDVYVDSNIVIRDLQIDGNGAWQTLEAQVSAIFFSRVSHSRVEGCWIHDVSVGSPGSPAILSQFTDGLVVRGSTIYDNRYAGVFLSLGTNCIVSNNVFINNHRAVYLANHLNGVVEGNQILSGDEGVRMYVAASNNLIQGNLIKDNREEGIIVTHSTCAGNYLVDNYLINNVVQILDDGTDTVTRKNEGYQTENCDVTSVANGSFISHGLVAEPTSVQLTASAERVVAVLSKNATHFQVGLWFLDGTAVTEPEEINWHVEV